MALQDSAQSHQGLSHAAVTFGVLHNMSCPRDPAQVGHLKSSMLANAGVPVIHSRKTTRANGIFDAPLAFTHGGVRDLLLVLVVGGDDKVQSVSLVEE